MNKLFAGCELKSVEYELPNGNKLTLRELTAKGRGKLRAIADGDVIEAQAQIVALGCDQLGDEDVEGLLELSGDLLSDMADKVLSLSGLTEDAKEEAKNV